MDRLQAEQCRRAERGSPVGPASRRIRREEPVGLRGERILAPAKAARPKRQRQPAARALNNVHPELSAYIVEVDVNCEECGGSGVDPGGIDPWGPEVCPKCQGAKTHRITRNYLAEAFQIAANPESTRQIERLHLVAVIQHCREAVSALVSLPEVA
jgi:hypothetical protein